MESRSWRRLCSLEEALSPPLLACVALLSRGCPSQEPAPSSRTPGSAARGPAGKVRAVRVRAVLQRALGEPDLAFDVHAVLERVPALVQRWAALLMEAGAMADAAAATELGVDVAALEAAADGLDEGRRKLDEGERRSVSRLRPYIQPTRVAGGRGPCRSARMRLRQSPSPEHPRKAAARRASSTTAQPSSQNPRRACS